MAKITAPLLSLGGRGSIAKSVVFSNWRGVNYARQHVIPGNPKTTAQSLTRNTFATLREMWKRTGDLGKAPWNAFATGRPFTGFNTFIGDNVRFSRGEADFAKFIGSPGARGGIPPVSVTASTGSGSGELDIAFSNPSEPDGWTITNAIAVAFPDQAPDALFGGPMVEGEDSSTFNAITLSGLGAATLCVAAGWLKWEKPDGNVAYSVSLTDTATTGA